MTGFAAGPGTVNGAIHAGDATASAAQASAGTACDALAAQGCDVDLIGQDPGGLTLTPGVYCFPSSAQLTGPLTLNAVGDPAAVFIFPVGTALTTASNASVVFTNIFAADTGATVIGRLLALDAAVTGVDHGGDALTRQAKIDINSAYSIAAGAVPATGVASEVGGTTLMPCIGNVLGSTSITATTGATVRGRLLTLDAAVTLDANTLMHTAGTATTTTSKGAPPGIARRPAPPFTGSDLGSSDA